MKPFTTLAFVLTLLLTPANTGQSCGAHETPSGGMKQSAVTR